MNDTKQIEKKEEKLEYKPKQKHKFWRKFGHVSLWLFGVVIPAVTCGVEVISGTCSNEFYEVFPTAIHLIIVCLVPLILAWSLLFLRKINQTSSFSSTNLITRTPACLIASLMGIALVASAYYTVISFPLIFMGIIASALFFWTGFGLLGLLATAPLGTGIVSIFLLAKLRTKNNQKKRMFSFPWFFAGVFISLFLLTISLLAQISTYYALQSFEKNPEKFTEEKILRVRNIVSRKHILSHCYNRSFSRRTHTSMLNGFSNRRSWQTNINTARALYFVLYGKQFNSEDPKFTQLSSFLPWQSSRRRTRWQWDEGIGGENVVGRIVGLDMTESRLDGHIDRASGLAYSEWTMVFENENWQNHEARMQIELPEDAVVSRLTLWVNGEEQESAFSSPQKVREAYQKVAVRQRRDPVLVTWAAHDRIMVQCFPVLGKRNTRNTANLKMKIRLGITSPLWKYRHYYLPRIVERNFGYKKNLTHSIWLQGDCEFTGLGTEDVVKYKNGKQSIQTELDTKQFYQAFWTLNGQIAEPTTYSKYHIHKNIPESDHRFVQRTFEEKKSPPKQSWTFVLDGSFALAPWKKTLEKIFVQLVDRNSSIDLYLATHDGVIHATQDSCVETIANHHFIGGVNNLEAVEKAWLKAMQKGDREIIWLHGPQPLELGDGGERLSQIIQRSPKKPRILHAGITRGVNHLLALFQKEGLVHPVPRHARKKDALHSFLLNQRDGTSHKQAIYKLLSDEPTDATKTWDHLTRMYVSRGIYDTYLTVPNEDARIKAGAKAAQFQLVTPYSGAVVLETKQQFKENDLEQVDADTTPQVPTIPEPSNALLILIGACSVLLRRRR